MTKATATPSSATDARHRQGEDIKFGSDLEDHSVACRLDLGSQALSHVGGQLPRMRAPYGHPKVRQNGEPRLGVADDLLGIGETEVGQPFAALHQNAGGGHDLRFVLFGDTVGVPGICDPYTS